MELRKDALRLCLLWSIALNSAFAQTDKAAAVDSAKATQQAVQEVTIRALQEEVKTYKEFTQHILATVYFALGTLGIVFAALVGYSWYQNFRVYERDKEAMESSLRAAMTAELSKGLDELTKDARGRILEVDAKFANALGTLHKRVVGLRLELAAAAFTATHEKEKTPRTDFWVLLQETGACIPHADPEAIRRPLTVIVEHIEGLSTLDQSTKTAVVDLLKRLPSELGALSDRINAALAKLG